MADLAAFDSYFHDVIVPELTAAAVTDNDLNVVDKHLTRLLLNTVTAGKKLRGLAVVNAYQTLAAERGGATDAGLDEARVLGWCIELMQAYFLVLDDIMDGSITRRGKPCWYKNADIGISAINDGILLERTMYQLLDNHFGNSDKFVPLLRLFEKYNRLTVYGQSLDMMATPPDTEVDLSKFSEERHAAIIKYKTAFYTCCLPIRCALYLHGIVDERVHQQAEAVLIKLGHLFQCQDDFLDYHAPPEVLGKIGTDIIDGKCSWPVNQALKMATVEQKKVLELHYGKKNADSEQKVKQLYAELKIDQVYEKFEERLHDEIKSEMKVISAANRLPLALFENYLNKLYKRAM